MVSGSGAGIGGSATAAKGDKPELSCVEIFDRHLLLEPTAMHQQASRLKTTTDGPSVTMDFLLPIVSIRNPQMLDQGHHLGP